MIVAYAVDRLSRSQNHIGILFDEFETSGVTLAFVTERFEDTAVGRFILAARAFIAEVEREKIAERTMRGKEERARSGLIPQATGRGMYGYHYDPTAGRRLVNGEQAAVVRRIFEDFPQSQERGLDGPDSGAAALDSLDPVARRSRLPRAVQREVPWRRCTPNGRSPPRDR